MALPVMNGLAKLYVQYTFNTQINIIDTCLSHTGHASSSSTSHLFHFVVCTFALDGTHHRWYSAHMILRAALQALLTAAVLQRTMLSMNQTQTQAACRGNLKILQWLHARGILWIEQVSTSQLAAYSQDESSSCFKLVEPVALTMIVWSCYA
jgi:hypothetical protein